MLFTTGCLLFWVTVECREELECGFSLSKVFPIDRIWLTPPLGSISQCLWRESKWVTTGGLLFGLTTEECEQATGEDGETFGKLVQ